MSHHHVIAGLAIVFLAVASFEEWSAADKLAQMSHGSQSGASQVQKPAQAPSAPSVPSPSVPTK